MDLSFDSHNSSRENNSLCKQLSLSYSVLKRERAPISLHLLFAGVNNSADRNNSSEGTDSTRSCAAYESLQLQGVDNWAVSQHWNCSSLLELFPAHQIIYLSPDAPEVLSDIDCNLVQ